jgi:AcrR family transcriptional regulator
VTRPPRPKHEIEEIKELILMRALDVIGEYGFAHMTMRKIAARSNMSATNLYNYFSNKDEIYILLVIRGFQTLYNEFASVNREVTDPEEKGRRFLRAYLKFGMENRHYYEIMFTQATPKFHDYVGTPLEELANKELKLSMEIAGMGFDLMAELLHIEDRDSVLLKNRIMQVWSLIHGTVSLFHSNIAGYIVDDQEVFFESIENEVVRTIIPVESQ